jgi:superfamily II DNA or RNA helicase
VCEQLLFQHNIEPYKELKKILEGSDLAILEAATGSGKSYITLQIILDHSWQALVLTPRTSLCDTWNATAEQVGAAVDTMTYQGFQNLRPRDVKKLKEKYDILVCDEAHHIEARQWGGNLRIFRDCARYQAKILGLTADTVRWLDGAKDVAETFFHRIKVEGARLSELIDIGVLPTFTYTFALYDLPQRVEHYRNEVVQSGTGTRKGRRLNKQRKKTTERLFHDLELNSKNELSIQNIIQKKLPEGDHRILVFVPTLSSITEYEDLLTEIFPGYTILHVGSHLSRIDNKKALACFQSLNRVILVSVDMMCEGIHCPGVDVEIMFRKTASPNLYFQMLGRVLSASNTDRPISIYDFVGNHRMTVPNGSSWEVSNSIQRLNQNISNPSRQIIVDDRVKPAVEIMEALERALKVRKGWSEEEDAIILKYYGKMGAKIAALLPDRTANSIASRARKLGIKSSHSMPWTSEEDQLLRDNYAEMGAEVSALFPGRTRKAVTIRVWVLGLQKRKTEANRERLAEQAIEREEGTSWTDEEIRILKENYPEMGMDVQRLLAGRSARAVLAKVRALHLDKGRKWTREEDLFLRKNYQEYGISKISDLMPGRTRRSIANRAKTLGLCGGSNVWTAEEDQKLNEHYRTASIEGLTKLFPNRTIAAIKTRAGTLGLTRRVWTEEEDAILKARFPDLGASVAELLPRRSVSACKKRAFVLGLARD